MKWPRLTTRRIIGIVFGLALALGLGLPAWEVWHHREYHAHAWIDRLDPLHPVPTQLSTSRRWMLSQSDSVSRHGLTKVVYVNDINQVEMPFWPRYWRHLLGLPWKMQKGCQPVGTQIELICELEHPEICHRTKTGRIDSISCPVSMQQTLNRLKHESRDH